MEATLRDLLRLVPQLSDRGIAKVHAFVRAILTGEEAQFHCPECGCTEVEYDGWIGANTGVPAEDDGGGTNYCPDCGEEMKRLVFASEVCGTHRAQWERVRRMRQIERLEAEAHREQAPPPPPAGGNDETAHYRCDG